VPLLVVPIALAQLGATGYGAWTTAVSVTSLVAFADLGIGTGLMTRLGRSTAGDQLDDSAQAYVSSAHALLAGVAGLALVLLFGFAALFDVGQLLGAAPGEGDVELITVVTLSAFILNMVVSLVVRVQYGIGQQGRSNLWQAAGSVAMLGAMWIAAVTTTGAGWFVAAAAFAPVLVALVNATSFYGFARLGRQLAPRPSLVNVDLALSLLRSGTRFFLVALMMTMSLALDPWIVAQTASLGDVPEYTIPFRVFAVIGSFGVLLALPLWPIHARAVVAGDVLWIRRITRRMTIASTGLVALGAGVAVVAGPRVVDVWLDGGISYDPVLWGGLAAWWVVQTATGPAFMVQNGAEILGPQMVGYSLLLTALPAKWLISQTIGFAWIPWCGTALYLLFVATACWVGYRRALAMATASGLSGAAS
jgi:O-antigen/teichoic acid export membrane protein